MSITSADEIRAVTHDANIKNISNIISDIMHNIRLRASGGEYTYTKKFDTRLIEIYKIVEEKFVSHGYTVELYADTIDIEW